MKIIFVLLSCAILNVLATYDTLNNRKTLEITNFLFRRHKSANNMCDKIKHVVARRELSMEKLTFMFALPEQDFGRDPDLQRELELSLQQWLLEGSGLTADEAAAFARGRKGLKCLGEERRNPRNHNMNFEHTCRIIGLFLSTNPTNYVTSAEVLSDNTCVISQWARILMSCKYVDNLILFVNNDRHDVTGGSVISFINNY
ncbi:uncharacterized protein LOC126835503 isoform X2 [Adelges cooleyi]|uniref:uncharacterized protein LOC126835503 isoform X2 n=1 Tax=Adelges cooleyi TaxID=133065 RepID=UPI00218073B9|nr:uncharacterized protein LOC126835503 isoform X2 [Adelges cooleyi]